MSWNFIDLRRKHTRKTQDEKNGYDCVHGYNYVQIFLGSNKYNYESTHGLSLLMEIIQTFNARYHF